MARMRKVARLWRNEGARAAAASVMVPDCPDYFTVDPRELFGREAPLELEIGAGRGDFILERAAAMPDRNFIAVELATRVAQLMAVRAGRRRVTNLRVLRMDARPLVHLMLAPHSLSACHIYFPDPWPKERHVKHRLFTPAFAHGLKRALGQGAPLFVATDVLDYAVAIFPMLEVGGFARASLAVPGATQTGFARKFIAEGRPIYSAAFIALS
jgi:tRNA (guanine-N7-)-methyltransferase